MKEDLCVENTIYWVTNDEVFSFKAGDRKACEEAIEQLRKKGISIS